MISEESAGDASSGAALDLLEARAAEYVAAAKAANTLRAYRSAWREFTAWADDRGLESLPASGQTLGLCLTDPPSDAEWLPSPKPTGPPGCPHRPRTSP